MAKSNPLALKSNETITFLKNQQLITHEHSLTISLIKHLCAEWDTASSSTQRAMISKELRACIELLPKPIPKTSDEAQEFLDDLNGDAK